MIRVLVAASSAIVRSGLEAVVRLRETLAMAGSLTMEALGDLPADTDVDVIAAAAATVGEELLGTLSELPCPAVLLTGEPEMQLICGSVRGVLRFDARPEEILAALEAVSEGLAVLPADQWERRSAILRAPEEQLTSREIEVLRLVAEGLSNKLIAHTLNISGHTVKAHVTQIMSKLRASSRTDAAMQGIRRGLVLI